MVAVGVDLHFGTFSALSRINRENRDSWRPLNPTFEPVNRLVDGDDAFVILGLDSVGQCVTATAMKVFVWQTTDLKSEAESLRLLFADPASMAPAGGGCRVTAPSATAIRGRVGYAGAGWLHPSVRKRRIGAVLSRILRAYAYARWQVDVVCAISSLELIGKGYTDQNGYRHMEPGIGFALPELGPPEAGLVWINAAETLEDLESTLAALSLGDRGRSQLGRAHDALLTGNNEWQDQAGVAHGGSAA